MEGSFWVLLVALVLFTTTLLVHRVIDNSWAIIRLPLTWFYSSWLLGLLLLSMPLFRYSESFSGETGAYVIAILLAASTGSVAAAFWARQNNKIVRTRIAVNSAPAVNISSRFLSILLILGAIGTGFVLLNAVLGGSVSFLGRFDAENSATIRREHLFEARNNIGIIFGPAYLISSIGSLGVAYVFFLKGARFKGEYASQWLFFLALVVLLTNLLVGIIGLGSRMFSVFAIVVAFVAFLEGRWSIGLPLIARRLAPKEATFIVAFAVAAAAGLWVTATVFVESRLQQQDPRAALYRTHRANLDPLAYQFTRDNPTSQYFMLSLSYATTPIPTLVYYLDLPESRQPGPFFGEYNFPAIWRWGRRLTFQPDPYAWDRARYDIFKPLGDIGFGMNVWSTLVRDLVADFGKMGAILFLVLVSFTAQRVFDNHRMQPTMRRAGFLVYVRLIFVFSGLVSMLFMTQIYWPLYLSALMMVAVPKTKGKSVGAGPPRQAAGIGATRHDDVQLSPNRTFRT